MLLPNRFILAALAGLACAPLAQAQVNISVNASANQRPIDPRIYGIHFGSTGTLDDLNATMNRYGGNSSGRYNWQQNIDNRGVDFFFESIPYADPTPGALGDSFISSTKNGGAEPFETLPMVDWIAKTDAGRNTLWSFSVIKYGAQCSSDGDAGDGLHVDCATFVVGNDPNDASTPNSSAIEGAWAQHIKDTFGPASTTGLKYWGYDNEPSIWFSAYRDVTPTGKHDTEMVAKMIDYGSAVRAVDPAVALVGPEEWGWDSIFFSGFDQQNYPSTPDRDAHGDYIPYLLDQMRQYEINNGVRLLDVASIHFYPQGTEYYPDSNASDVPTQLLRNRSTRGLWDPNYLNESYINDFVQLVPRMKGLISTYYPGLPFGLTEYNWGGDFIMNGATVQADILGILGREGADMAIRWDTSGFTPAMPPYQAFKLYRNYDGAKSTFGNTSVLASVPDADTVTAFAAVRSSDGALTVMVINKNLAGGPSVAVNVNIAGFTPGPNAQGFQVAGAGTSITPLGNVPVAGNVLSATVPSPSVTLFVIPAAGVPTPSMSIADTSLLEGNAGTTNAQFAVTLSATAVSPVTVDYATADGSATAGSDYVATSGTLTISPGVISGQILVPVNGDPDAEGDETFLVNLSAATGATIADGQAIATILNDDVAVGPNLSITGTTVAESAGVATFVVTADAVATSTISVNYATADGTAAAGFDYGATAGMAFISAGAQTTSISVSVLDDALDEPDETFSVTLSGAVGGTITGATANATIQDDDGGTLVLPEINHGLDMRRDFVQSSEALYRLTQQPHSSYEVLVDSLSGDVTPLDLELLGPDYTPLFGSVPAGSGISRSLRLENGDPLFPVSTQFVRVRSGGCVNTCTTDESYRLRLYDTTYRIARFNNSASQVTVLVLRNQGDATVTGHVWASGTSGAPIGNQAFTLAPHGTFTLNTGSLAPGASGSLTVSSDGAYGQLSGKAVAVEPATGFTFDTLMEARPR